MQHALDLKKKEKAKNAEQTKRRRKSFIQTEL